VKTKNAITVILLLFVAASVVVLLVDAFRSRATVAGGSSDAAVLAEATLPADPDSRAESAAQGQRRVIAYYFHGTYRCTTCLTMEEYARQALTTGFSEELESGVVEWQVINVEEPAHQHFINDYQLYTKSLILAEMDGDTQVRWKNLERIWDLVGDREAFISYVQAETRAYLAGNP
jgi:hypothetical protein